MSLISSRYSSGSSRCHLFCVTLLSPLLLGLTITVGEVEGAEACSIFLRAPARAQAPGDQHVLKGKLNLSLLSCPHWARGRLTPPCRSRPFSTHPTVVPAVLSSLGTGPAHSSMQAQIFLFLLSLCLRRPEHTAQSFCDPPPVCLVNSIAMKITHILQGVHTVYQGGT